LAAALKAGFGVEAQLIQGGGGVFDVTVDDEVIYSKHDTGRFPTNEEIVALIQERKS
jgi:selenoprotein W-related protein